MKRILMSFCLTKFKLPLVMNMQSSEKLLNTKFYASALNVAGNHHMVVLLFHHTSLVDFHNNFKCICLRIMPCDTFLNTCEYGPSDKNCQLWF